MKYVDLKLLSSILQSVITNEETKVQKKLIKIYDKLKPSLQEYQDKANELRIDNASVDEKDILLLDEKGNYRFSKQNIKILNKQLQELDNQEVVFEKIAITNPQGLEQFLFLKDWVTGVPFQEEVDEEL
jgi:predicted nuclease with TOPRIM domain